MGALAMIFKLGTDAAKLVSVLNYDGMPITADNIYRQITGLLDYAVTTSKFTEKKKS